jgi:hypothetical protein
MTPTALQQPAWVGLALAGVMVVAAAIPYLAVPGERTPTTVAPPWRDLTPVRAADRPSRPITMQLEAIR